MHDSLTTPTSRLSTSALLCLALLATGAQAQFRGFNRGANSGQAASRAGQHRAAATQQARTRQAQGARGHQTGQRGLLRPSTSAPAQRARARRNPVAPQRRLKRALEHPVPNSFNRPGTDHWLEASRRRQAQRHAAKAGRGSSRARIGLPAISLTLDSITADPERKAAARKAARGFFGKRFTVGKTRRGLRAVTRLPWNKKLKDAARQAARGGKPILWIQALGDLAGYT